MGAGVEGETVVVLGGIMVHRGLLPFFPAAMVAAAGSFVADQLFFLLGRSFRTRPFVRRMQQRPTFAKATAAFNKHPTLFVFAFRFLYGLRTVSPIAIGTTRLSCMKFLAINAVAAVVWGLVFVTLGYCFGNAIERAFGRLHSLAPLLAIALVVVAVGAILLYNRRRSMADETDSQIEQPAPLA